MRIIGVGDNVCDKYRTLSMMFPGGQALNVAVYCRMQGAESAFMGAFGRDAVGNHMRKTLDELDVDYSHCRIYDGENGYAVVDLVNGDRVFVTSNRGGVLREHPLQLTTEDLEYLQTFDIIHTSNNSYLDNQLFKLAGLHRWISYDFSRTWNDELRLRCVAPLVSFAFLSCSELSEKEIHSLLDRIHNLGCAITVATMGSRGAIAWDGKHLACHRPDLVKVVDTLGAGDSFAAGFLMECYKQGHLPYSEEALLRCMEQGAILSRATCQIQGAFGYGTPMV